MSEVMRLLAVSSGGVANVTATQWVSTLDNLFYLDYIYLTTFFVEFLTGIPRLSRGYTRDFCVSVICFNYS